MSDADQTPPSPDEGQPQSQNAQNPPLRARVPDHVAGGTFSTGAIVMTGQTEYIVDFLQTIGRPHKIAARVIIPHGVMPQFIEALTTNLDLYRNRFGDPVTPQPPQPNPDARRPTPQEIYDDLKMPDEVLSGTYANGVMIGHGATEFGLDFLTSFFPQSAVSARVFVAAGQIPRLLESLRGAVRQLEQRRNASLQGGVANLTPANPASPNPNAPPSSNPNDPPTLEQGPGSSGTGGQDSGGQDSGGQDVSGQEPPEDKPPGPNSPFGQDS